MNTRLLIFKIFWLPVIATLTVVAVCALPGPIQAGKPSGGSGLTNPAWLVLDGNGIKLLASDGVSSQALLKSGRLERFHPAYSPDGRWIAYMQRENGAIQIYRMRADGSANQRIAAFSSQDERFPVPYYGLQWVPGEVDRILYTGVDTQKYVFSTLTGQLSILAGVGYGPALSPDLDPTTAGYQGAVAFAEWNPNDPDPTSKLDIHISLVEDTPTGMTVNAESTVLLPIPGQQSLPTWSNDSFSLAFLDQGGPDWGQLLKTVPVLVANPGILIFDTDVLTLEVRPKGIYDRPTWSPDDRWIAYIGQVGAAPGGGKLLDLFRVRSDGSQAPTNVTDSHADAINSSGRPLMPHWSPAWINDVEGP